MTQQEEKIIIITKGEKAVFDIYVKTEGRPFDLTGFDQFQICLEKEEGTLSLTQVANGNGSKIEKIAPDVLGHLKVTVGPADTALLKTGFGQDMDLELDNSVTPNTKRRRLHKSLNVEESTCV